ncbi:MAG: transporter substrate-binding domain-containing protein [Alcaligenaceae bacterium]|nr:transporter substrate-binding domain-containing protein [Alcaligenaceae bacterium]
MQCSIPEVARNLAPSGVLRVALNFGNPGLVHEDVHTGAPSGLAVDLAQALARELELDIEFVRYESAPQIMTALDEEPWDMAFLAVSPRRRECLQFTRPYLVVPGTYLVRGDSPLRDCKSVDRDGLRIAVGTGTASDHYLSRHLKHASLDGARTSAGALDLFAEQSLDAVAGLQSCLAPHANPDTGYRLLDGHFMMIEHAIATPRLRTLGWAYLASYTERMMACRFIEQSLARRPQSGARVPI